MAIRLAATLFVAAAPAAPADSQMLGGVPLSVPSGWPPPSIMPDGSVKLEVPGIGAITLSASAAADLLATLGSLHAGGLIQFDPTNGVIFLKERIDVAGLVAGSMDASDPITFAYGVSGATNKSGTSLDTQNMFTAAEAGVSRLVAPQARNSGLIVAGLGRVELASDTKLTLDFYGDSLISFTAGAHALLATKGDDKTIAVVDRSVGAESRRVALTAETARDLVTHLVLGEDDVIARSIRTRGGKIILGGAGTGTQLVAATQSAHAFKLRGTRGAPTARFVEAPKLRGTTWRMAPANAQNIGAGGSPSLTAGGELLTSSGFIMRSTSGPLVGSAPAPGI